MSNIRFAPTAIAATLSSALAVAHFDVVGAPIWTMVGAGCVPIGQTIQGNLHINVAGKTKFFPGKTGEIILTCPITTNVGSARCMTMSYFDPDGAVADINIKAALRRAHRVTGSAETVMEINSSTFFVITYNFVGRNLETSIDQSRYDYYVQINMKYVRRVTVFDPSFGAVSLDSSSC